VNKNDVTLEAYMINIKSENDHQKMAKTRPEADLVEIKKFYSNQLFHDYLFIYNKTQITLGKDQLFV
jgi:hypothetical protein